MSFDLDTPEMLWSGHRDANGNSSTDDNDVVRDKNCDNICSIAIPEHTGHLSSSLFSDRQLLVPQPIADGLQGLQRHTLHNEKVNVSRIGILPSDELPGLAHYSVLEQQP